MNWLNEWLGELHCCGQRSLRNPPICIPRRTVPFETAGCYSPGEHERTGRCVTLAALAIVRKSDCRLIIVNPLIVDPPAPRKMHSLFFSFFSFWLLRQMSRKICSQCEWFCTYRVKKKKIEKIIRPSDSCQVLCNTHSMTDSPIFLYTERKI